MTLDYLLRIRSAAAPHVIVDAGNIHAPGFRHETGEQHGSFKDDQLKFRQKYPELIFNDWDDIDVPCLGRSRSCG